MSSSNFSYPHPILGNNDDIIPGLQEKCVVALTTTDDNYHYYQFVMSIDDTTIIELINNGKAKYAIHYKCKSTRFEGCEYGTTNTVTVKIPRKEIIGKIDFKLSVIATESFTYLNPSANAEYLGCSSDIKPNDPLVFFPDQWDYLDLTHQTLKHYSSILVPYPDERIEGNDVLIVTDERIEVHISTDAYEKLQSVKMPDYSTEVISTYVQTGLMTALFQLFCNSEDIEDIRNNEKAWVQAILKRMREESDMPSLEDVVNNPFEEVPSLVQKLLQYPMGELLSKLANIIEPESEIDNTNE